ncbi:MAG: hypothetical protein HC841_00175 [Verrucomicrobiae bacterium]|nr:hypothetical protein [Verrucomicrobiae bacterium]
MPSNFAKGGFSSIKPQFEAAFAKALEKSGTTVDASDSKDDESDPTAKALAAEKRIQERSGEVAIPRDATSEDVIRLLASRGFEDKEIVTRLNLRGLKTIMGKEWTVPNLSRVRKELGYKGSCGGARIGAPKQNAAATPKTDPLARSLALIDRALSSDLDDVSRVALIGKIRRGEVTEEFVLKSDVEEGVLRLFRESVFERSGGHVVKLDKHDARLVVAMFDAVRQYAE